MGELLLIEGNLDLVLEPSPDLDCGDTGDRLETLLQFVVGEATQLLEFGFVKHTTGIAAGKAEADDRVGRRIEAQQHRLLRFQRQAEHVQLVTRVEAGHFHVRAPGELEDHVGLAGARYRVDAAHVLDRAECFLYRLRYQILHLDRRRALVLGAHGQGWIGQIGQQVDLQSGKGDQAEQHQGQRGHADRHASACGEFDEVHCAPSSTCTCVPSRTAARPMVMTRSPSSRPSRISTCAASA